MRADRLLRLIVLLQRHGRARAGWLAEQLEVSERTVLRDMEALSAAGVPVYTERGPHGGCVLMEGFTTDASGLTTQEAQALFAWTSHDTVADLGLGAELTGALAKVAASVSTTATQGAEALGAVLLSDRRRWFAASESVPLLPVLREAAQQGRRVRLVYRSAGAAAPGLRTVDPYGLVDHSGVWYFVAAHRGRDRTFRVSRILDATVLDARAVLPGGRTLADVWPELRGRFEADRRNPVTVELSVASGAADELRPIARSQLASGTDIDLLAVEAGRERWRLQVRARQQAIAMALAFAPAVRVVAPAELVADVRRQAGVAVAAYG
jgi:predicted DNA-binding transcriptional regulator YafY